MITALEARNLSGPTPQERVDEIEPLIRTAAEKKLRRAHLQDSFWVHEGYSKTDHYKQAVKILEDLGYKVKFYYDDGGQFVNMYTIVEW